MARGEPRQENQKTEIRGRKGKEIEKERRKENMEMRFHRLRNQYGSRKSLLSQGSSRVGVFFIYASLH